MIPWAKPDYYGYEKKYINKLYTNDIELANNSKIKLIK